MRSKMLTAERIIELLDLKPLPVEGGYFRRTYVAEEQVDKAGLPGRYAHSKAFGSAIYFFLHGAEFSAVHRLLTDEIYHFYLGDPVELLLLYPDGTSTLLDLGPDLEQGQHVQVVVRRGVWQGLQLKTKSGFALLGTTLAPGFDPTDFELGDRAALIQTYSARDEIIRMLTRAS